MSEFIWELGDVGDGGRSRYLHGKVNTHHYFMYVYVLLAPAPPSVLCALSMVWWPLDILWVCFSTQQLKNLQFLFTSCFELQSVSCKLLSANK